MIHKLYSVYDSKAETYSLPFFTIKEEMAIRTYKDWVNDPDHPFGKHPEDYTLFSTGEYDDSTGTMTQEKITSVINGLQLLDQEKQK